MAREITNSEDYIDTRDVEERIVELQQEIRDYKKDVKNGVGAEIVLEEMQEELKNLQDLKEECINAYGESSYESGMQLIRDSYFTEYAEELASDIGDIPRDRALQWPYTHINWDEASQELQQDYSEVDFNGVIYWTREA